MEFGGNPDLLYKVSKGDQLVRMLSIGRINLIAYSDITAFKLMKKNGINYLDYEVVFTFSQGITAFSFNKNVNPEIIKKLQKAFDQLETDGTVIKIRNLHVNSI